MWWLCVCNQGSPIPVLEVQTATQFAGFSAHTQQLQLTSELSGLLGMSELGNLQPALQNDPPGPELGIPAVSVPAHVCQLHA